MKNKLKSIGSSIAVLFFVLIGVAQCVGESAHIRNPDTGEYQNLVSIFATDLYERFRISANRQDKWITAQSEDGKVSFMIPEQFRLEDEIVGRLSFVSTTRELIVECEDGLFGFEADVLNQDQMASMFMETFYQEANAKLQQSGTVQINGREVFFAEVEMRPEGRLASVYTINGNFEGIGGSCHVTIAKFGEQPLPEADKRVAEKVLSSVDWNLKETKVGSEERASSLVTKGFIGLHSGKLEEAIDKFTQAIDLDSENGEGFAGRGLAYDTTGRYTEALSDLSNAVELGIERSDVYTSLGFTRFATGGDLEQCLEDFDNAIELDANNARAYGGRGIVYTELEQFEKAIDDFSKGVELAPKDHKSYRERGRVYGYIENYEQAIEDYDAAIKLNPQYPQAYRERGTIYLQAENFESAVADFTEAIEQAGNDSEDNINMYLNYFSRGVALAQLGNLEQALDDYNESITLVPDFIYAHSQRGYVNSQLGRHEQAIADFEKYIELAPSDDPYLTNIRDMIDQQEAQLNQ